MLDPVSEAHDQWMRHGWDDAADGMSAVLDLVRVHRLLMERIYRSLKPWGLTLARYEVLMLLSFGSRETSSIGHIARLLQVHSTSITSTVDGLESDGLVRRVKSDGDRRMVMVRLTSAGRKAASEATQELNSEVFTALGLSLAEQKRLWTVLRAFRANAGDFDSLSDRMRRTG